MHKTYKNKSFKILVVTGLMVIGLAACAASSPAAAPAAPAAAPTQSARAAPKESPNPNAPQAAEQATAAPAAPAEPAPAVTQAAEQATAIEQPTSAAPVATAAMPEAPKVIAPTDTALPLPTPTLQPAPTDTAIPIPTLKPFATDTRIAPLPSLTPPPTVAPSRTALPQPTPTQDLAAGAADMQQRTAEITPTAEIVLERMPAQKQTQVITEETRIVELEFPERMQLGNTDIVRIALIPSYEGYTVTTEFSGNQVVTKSVVVNQMERYDLLAVARLDGAGFAISPNNEVAKALARGQTVDWRWSIRPNEAGQQRIAIQLKLRWVPQTGSAGTQKEADIFTRGLNVQVQSVLGMSAATATSTGVLGLILGGGMSLLGLFARRAPKIKQTVAQVLNPNSALQIEMQPAIQLENDERSLLQTLFGKYSRVVLQNEFRSGYSGARTFLAHPIREDGRADAYTIAKIGSRESMQREFDNYERYVKDTLPPITARIQEPPVTVASAFNKNDKAVLRYTFIGEQGRMPVSLREALIQSNDPTLLTKLFETFGPNWWMQRKPYLFRLAQEYDRMMPAHVVVEAFNGNSGAAKLMDGRKPAEQDSYKLGDVVVLQNFADVETRVDGKSLSLTGTPSVANGLPALRVRWQGLAKPSTFGAGAGAFGKVIGTRELLLRELIGNVNRGTLPDPILALPKLLNENVQGTQSTVHGDMNLENGLVGLGNFIWLIDFANTRDGHTLCDFAHLEAEVIAHVIAPNMQQPLQIVDAIANNPLLAQLHEIAGKCLFNPTQMREYWLAVYATCLGAVKFANLSLHQRQCLYLSAAKVMQDSL